MRTEGFSKRPLFLMDARTPTVYNGYSGLTASTMYVSCSRAEELRASRDDSSPSMWNEKQEEGWSEQKEIAHLRVSRMSNFSSSSRTTIFTKPTHFYILAFAGSFSRLRFCKKKKRFFFLFLTRTTSTFLRLFSLFSLEFLMFHHLGCVCVSSCCHGWVMIRRESVTECSWFVGN